jgi:ABC transporter fused permease/ATP-binding protein
MASLNSGGKMKADMPKAKLSADNIRQSLFIFRYIKPYRIKFIAALLFLSLGSAMSLAYPYLFGQLMDIAAGNETKYFGQDISKVFLVIVALLGIGTVLSYFRITWFAMVGEKALADLRLDLYGGLLRLPMAFFAQRRVGELISRVTADLSQIQDTLSTFLANVLRQSITLIAGIAIILVTNIKLAGLMLLVIPFVVLFAFLFGKKIRQISRDTQDKLADTGVILEESLQGIANVKAFTNEKFEIQRYKKGIGLVVEMAIKNARFRGAFAATVVLFMFGAISLVMFSGIKMIQSGEMRIGELNSFIFYGMFIAGSMAGFAENYNQLQKTVGATQRVREIFDEKREDNTLDPHSSADHNSHVDSNFHANLSFQNIRFSYPSRPELSVLNDISFTIPNGKKVALVGGSGAGKSTITSLLLRFYQPDAGTISLNGKDIKTLNLQAYREKIGIVPQDAMLFGGSILENIRYGKPEATESEITDAAVAANADAFIRSFPQEYETTVGDRGIKLSGGQKQRIAIARAILKNPEILILDEATSSLDSASEHLVQQALERLLKNRTSLVIAHRLSTIRDADEIIVLDQGKIAERGTHDQLISQNGIYARFVSLQSVDGFIALPDSNTEETTR